MASHHQWAERVIAQRQSEKLFAPENGELPKFLVAV